MAGHTKDFFELTAVLIPDKKTGDISAFFAQFPGAIAQGKTDKEAIDNLVTLIKLVMVDKKEEALNSFTDGLDFKTQPYKLVHA